jgi:hypothetical protein
LQIRYASMRDQSQTSSLKSGGFAALFALGRDAWNILPWLELMRSDPDFHFKGQSGSYSHGPAATLQREPAWAVFRNGIPVHLKTQQKPGGMTLASPGETPISNAISASEVSQGND